MERGPLITLEGGEGVGKTTQQRMLVRRIRGLGRQVVATREPGGTPLGRALRDLLQTRQGQDPDGLTELWLYLADRSHHLDQVVRPALEQGQVVISDRFVDSSEVYQGRARGLDWEWVRQLNRRICGDLWPDLTMVLDLDPGQGLARAAARQGSLGLAPDRLEGEGLQFHQQVRQGFLDQVEAEPQRMRLVDAARPAEEVAEAIWGQVEPLLKSWRWNEA